MNPLRLLEQCGQSPWLDYLKCSLISSGDLRTMIERDGLKGITSNPSIFEAAIGESEDYADAIQQFQSQADHDVSAIYEHLAIADIRAAADALGPVYEQTAGRDGYVSLECSPYLANDTDATVAEARRLWAAVERFNLMVKVPATPAGLPAIRQLIASGINVNVTLLFSVATYEAVAEAYLSGLEDLAGSGGTLARIGSVASMFVSRIDSAIDKRLDKLAARRAPSDFAAGWRSPMPSSLMIATRRCFPARDGSVWPTPERRPSDCSGPPPAPSLRPSRTPFMSRR